MQEAPRATEERVKQKQYGLTKVRRQVKLQKQTHFILFSVYGLRPAKEERTIDEARKKRG